MSMEIREQSRRSRRCTNRVLAACLSLVALGSGNIQAGAPLVQNQITPMRQDSIRLSTDTDVPRAPLSVTSEAIADPMGQPPTQLPLTEVGVGYDPSGRRDPFAPVVQELRLDKADVNLPPLQRVTLTELNLIAIVWGSYGYTAMVQTPEGHGYAVRRGTRIGQNNGVVSAITERGIIVQERFTDVYGKKQEREYVKLLHPKEGSE